MTADSSLVPRPRSGDFAVEHRGVPVHGGVDSGDKRAEGRSSPELAAFVADPCASRSHARCGRTPSDVASWVRIPPTPAPADPVGTSSPRTTMLGPGPSDLRQEAGPVMVNLIAGEVRDGSLPYWSYRVAIPIRRDIRGGGWKLCVGTQGTPPDWRSLVGRSPCPACPPCPTVFSSTLSLAGALSPARRSSRGQCLRRMRVTAVDTHFRQSAAALIPGAGKGSAQEDDRG